LRLKVAERKRSILTPIFQLLFKLVSILLAFLGTRSEIPSAYLLTSSSMGRKRVGELSTKSTFLNNSTKASSAPNLNPQNKDKCDANPLLLFSSDHGLQFVNDE